MVPSGFHMPPVMILYIGLHFHETSQRALNGFMYKTEFARMQSAYGSSLVRKRGGCIFLGKILIMCACFQISEIAVLGLGPQIKCRWL